MQPPLAKIQRIQLAVEIAPVRLRHTRVRRQDVDDVLLDDAATDELHRRNAEALLETLCGLGVEITRHVAANIEPMADRSEPGEYFSVAHQRAHQPHIVEMRAAV